MAAWLWCRSRAFAVNCVRHSWLITFSQGLQGCSLQKQQLSGCHHIVWHRKHAQAFATKHDFFEPQTWISAQRAKASAAPPSLPQLPQQASRILPRFALGFRHQVSGRDICMSTPIHLMSGKKTHLQQVLTESASISQLWFFMLRGLDQSGLAFEKYVAEVRTLLQNALSDLSTKPDLNALQRYPNSG